MGLAGHVAECDEPVDRGGRGARGDPDPPGELARTERPTHEQVLHRLEIGGVDLQLFADRTLELLAQLDELAKEHGRRPCGREGGHIDVRGS